MKIGARAHQRAQAPIRFRLATKLFGSFRLPRTSGLLFSRGRCIALLEASAAAGVAALQEGRSQVVAPTVSADQLIRAGRRSRPLRILRGFRGTRGLRSGSDDRLLSGRYSFAALRG